jgi:hypothetical protein
MRLKGDLNFELAGFQLVGEFIRKARVQGLDKDWVNDVVEDATSLDMVHLINTLKANVSGESNDQG